MFDKNASTIGTSITGTPYFQRTSRRMLQNINSNMERTDHGMNLHRISLIKKASSCWWKYLCRLYSSESRFPYSPSGHPNAKVRTPSSEIQSLMKVWTAQQTRAIESTRLQWGSNADAMTTDGWTILCNRLDAKVACPDALQ
jgi:hypothetical protein